ncbi:NAD-dependent protein deacetylase [Planctomycetales bacterium 10988]|nr:NAD-dependent protein deacetylase [Planctomycetales bacterium 10988]
MDNDAKQIEKAAGWINEARSLLIASGAGMGVDSGLPDFRGPEGFWKAYPVFRERNLSFYDLANPQWFDTDPEQAWGFYGHRRNLYRSVEPHDGFIHLLRWAESCPEGYFVFTSNIDGHFQKAGFASERIVECHGSIRHLQRVGDTASPIWPAEDEDISLDEATLRAVPPLPCCPQTGQPARPNVLMFGDWEWNGERTEAQWERYETWLRSLDPGGCVIIECGAGTAVPTVRSLCERLPFRLIRINLRECSIPNRRAADGIELPLPALEALTAMKKLLSSKG